MGFSRATCPPSSATSVAIVIIPNIAIMFNIFPIFLRKFSSFTWRRGTEKRYQRLKCKYQKYNVKPKTGFRIPRLRHSRAGKCGMTDLGLILFGSRFLDYAPVLSDESTGASLEMTGCVEWCLTEHFYRRPRFASYRYTEAR
jgi:hypothetical protein